jgi:hypothetical protein
MTPSRADQESPSSIVIRGGGSPVGSSAPFTRNAPAGALVSATTPPSPALISSSAPGRIPSEVPVLREGGVVVFSDAELSPERARRLAARAREADSFVRSQLGWSPSVPRDRVLELHVLRDETMRHRYGTALGITSGSQSVVLADGFLDEERSERTLAHELTHVQDRALLRGGARVPQFILEGRAMASGREFGKLLAIEPERYDEKLARTLASVKASEAKKFIYDEAYLPEARTERVATMEAVGFFFVELTRVRAGWPDVTAIQSRLSRVVETVGVGARLEDAWFGVFRSALRDDEAAFVDWLARTEGDAPARFRGTALEGALGSGSDR